ncbi:hypothetical protein C8F04DRAFT_724397 [Mycena alexandri]|uniref:Uncharacterized protein n=1 Tax=Mycena alexandri TaxID=1745969 RepID=A0AAD6TG19_9AGAR|nr:hypothetical protein C8F04DRAFT_724397 [Mycena alexandri]
MRCPHYLSVYIVLLQRHYLLHDPFQHLRSLGLHIVIPPIGVIALRSIVDRHHATAAPNSPHSPFVLLLPVISPHLLPCSRAAEGDVHGLLSRLPLDLVPLPRDFHSTRNCPIRVHPRVRLGEWFERQRCLPLPMVPCPLRQRASDSMRHPPPVLRRRLGGRSRPPPSPSLFHHLPRRHVLLPLEHARYLLVCHPRTGVIRDQKVRVLSFGITLQCVLEFLLENGACPVCRSMAQMQALLATVTWVG